MGEKGYLQGYLGKISIYDYFNQGVDLILEQFRECEKELEAIEEAEKKRDERLQSLEKERRKKENVKNAELSNLDQEKDEAVRRLDQEQQELKDRKRSVEEEIARLSNAAPGVREGRLTEEGEERSRRKYTEFLNEQKEKMMQGTPLDPLFEPLASRLHQEKELIFKQGFFENRISEQKAMLNKNAEEKALSEILNFLTEQERKNPVATVQNALKFAMSPGDEETFAVSYADGKCPLDGRVFPFFPQGLISFKTINKGFLVIGGAVLLFFSVLSDSLLPILLLAGLGLCLYAVYARKKRNLRHMELLEEGRQLYPEALANAKELVQAYSGAYNRILSEEEHEIRNTEQSLSQTKVELESLRAELEQDKKELGEAFRRQSIASEDEAWNKNRQEFSSSHEKMKELDKKIQDCPLKRASIDESFSRKRAKLERELDAIQEEERRQKESCQRVWEEEDARLKERYEKQKDDLLRQMREDGFQSLTRNESGHPDRHRRGFDYRKAWIRMYYLATSVSGMPPYYGWLKPDDVLRDMMFDAAALPAHKLPEADKVTVSPSRMVTGIEHCPLTPLASDLQKEVKDIMTQYWTEKIIDTPEPEKKYGISSALLPKDGFYKLRVNEVDRGCEEGYYHPTIFVYDFRNLDENETKRRKLRDFTLRTLCAPILNCWGLNPTNFTISIMLKEHVIDYENYDVWNPLLSRCETARIYKGNEITDALEELVLKGKETIRFTGSAGVYETVRQKAQEGETFAQDRLMIMTNMDYRSLSQKDIEYIEAILDMTNKDGAKSGSGICPYFFMDLHRLEYNIEGKEDKAATEVCLRIVKKFKGNIYHLHEKENQADYEKYFYDWEALEREQLQDKLKEIMLKKSVS